MRIADALSVRETAKLLACTIKYVFDLLHAGRLHGARKDGRVWRIPSASVHAYLASRAGTTSPEVVKVRSRRGGAHNGTAGS